MAEKKSSLSEGDALDIVYLEPGDQFDVSGIDFSDVTIELIGSDVIIFNPANGAKIVLPSLALMLFDESQSPQIFFGDVQITPKMISDKIGAVINVSKDDFVSYTTLDVNVDDAEDDPKNSEDLELENQQLQAEIEEILQSSQEIQMLADTLTVENAQLQAKAAASEKEEDKEFENTAEFIPEEETTATSNDDSSATSSSSATETTLGSELDSVTSFSFQAFLLQTGSSEDTSGPNFTVFGGGGVADATFDPDNSVQLLPETLDYTLRTDDIVINADDTNLFDDTHITRSIEIVPTLPDGFAMSSATISGLPTGAEIIDGTPAGAGSYDVDLSVFPLNSRGNLQVNMKYPIPLLQTFDLEIAVSATFDPSSGLVSPSVTNQIFILNQTVEQRDVSSSTDLNYTDADGNLIWVLANEANANTILSGTGNDVINGSGGQDTIFANGGDDIVNGNAGNDVIDAGDGQDIIFAGTGNDDVTGGSNIDLIDYSNRTDGITVDMRTLDGDGYASVSVGTSETDRIRQIENITGSQVDDNITADDGDNHIIGGDGNDILDGALGDDIIDGGAGNDTLSFLSGTSGLTVNLGTGGTVNVGTGSKTITSIENITATNFIDTITAVGGDNNISGAGAADIFITDGVGNDVFDGGANGSDNSTNDTIDYSTSLNGITVDLTSTPDGNGYYSLNVGGTTDLIRNIENITGSDTAGDNITGDANSQTLRGGGGNDTINGDQGDDIIYGGSGTNILDGGTGGESATGDTYNMSDFAQFVTLNMTDSASGTSVSNAETTTYSNFERYVLTNHNDVVNSSAEDDIVSGGNGNDIFYASAGSDTFDGQGGSGDEINYSTRGAGIYIEVDLNASPNLTVNVRNSADDTLIEQDVINNIENVVGSDGNDSFIDGSSSNTIDGGNGNDTLSYAADSTAISFNMRFTSGGFYTITQGSESDNVARVESIIGSSAGDSMEGDDEANNFSGNAGDDTFIAGIGGDTYEGGADIDFVNYSNVTGINSVVIDLSVFGTSASTVALDLGAVGADASDTIDTFIDEIENVSGTSGNDTITGNSLDNVIFDLGGDDVLDGGTGTNTIDYSLLSGQSVTVDLNAGTADDDGGAGSTDSLTNFLNINGSNQGDILTGDGNINTINGNNGDDTINGGAGDDILNGGAGADTFDGGAGDDTIVGGTGDDRVSYAGVNSVTVNLNLGTATDGFGNTDTLTSIEAVTTSSDVDTIIMALDTVQVDAEGGNDVITSNIHLGSSRVSNIDGGADDDTISYTAAPGITGGGITGTIANISVSGKTDIVSNVERFLLGNAGDDFSIDTSAIATHLNEFDANGGTDSVSVTGTGGSDLSATDIDGDTLAGIFTDLEQFDFRGTDLSGADTFDISDSHVTSITGGGNSLSILIDGTNIQLSDFNFLTGGGISNIDADADPNVQHVQWSSGAELIVSVV